MATQLPSSSLLLLSLAASLLLPASCQFTPPSVTNYDLPVATWIFYKALEWLGHNEPSKMHIKTLFMDQFNDINDHLSAQSMVGRAGFLYETYNVTSDDGYITQLVRIVNKLVQADRIKSPPVVIYGGQSISAAAFAMASNLQHHPTPYPLSGYWPHESSNRSLALLLSNNGYDVWLVSARGVDRFNRARLATNASQLKPTNTSSSQAYWSFSNDEIIEFEFRRQLEFVMAKTGRNKVSLVSYSNGCFVSFAFLASQSEFALEHIDTLVAIAPAVYVNKFNLYLRLAAFLADLIPSDSPVFEDNVDSAMRALFAENCRDKLKRYTACKLFLDSLFGHSDAFQTFFELNILDHIIRPPSAKSVRQLIQVADSGNFGKFNERIEGHLGGTGKRAEYNLTEVNLPRVFLFSGGRDSIADKESVGRLVDELGRKLVEHFKIEDYNHLDMLAGWDVGAKLNAPVLQILDRRYLESVGSERVKE